MQNNFCNQANIFFGWGKEMWRGIFLCESSSVNLTLHFSLPNWTFFAFFYFSRLPVQTDAIGT